MSGVDDRDWFWQVRMSESVSENFTRKKHAAVFRNGVHYKNKNIYLRNNYGLLVYRLILNEHAIVE